MENLRVRPPRRAQRATKLPKKSVSFKARRSVNRRGRSWVDCLPVLNRGNCRSKWSWPTVLRSVATQKMPNERCSKYFSCFGFASREFFHLTRQIASRGNDAMLLVKLLWNVILRSRSPLNFEVINTFFVFRGKCRPRGVKRNSNVQCFQLQLGVNVAVCVLSEMLQRVECDNAWLLWFNSGGAAWWILIVTFFCWDLRLMKGFR